MARPRSETVVQIPPRVRGFIPLGYYSNEDTPVQLSLEEYESLRLLDYENLSQDEAAVLMETSRPTLTRIYNRARKKIARCLVESNQLIIEGGSAVFKGEWYYCEYCGNQFNNPRKLTITACALCNQTSIKPVTN